MTGITPAMLIFSGMRRRPRHGLAATIIRWRTAPGFGAAPAQHRQRRVYDEQKRDISGDRTPFARPGDRQQLLGRTGRNRGEDQEDMPLPMPRSVMSSPSHMMTPVPANHDDDHHDESQHRLVTNDSEHDWKSWPPRASKSSSSP